MKVKISWLFSVSLILLVVGLFAAPMLLQFRINQVPMVTASPEGGSPASWTAIKVLATAVISDQSTTQASLTQGRLSFSSVDGIIDRINFGPGNLTITRNVDTNGIQRPVRANYTGTVPVKFEEESAGVVKTHNLSGVFVFIAPISSAPEGYVKFDFFPENGLYRKVSFNVQVKGTPVSSPTPNP